MDFKKQYFLKEAYRFFPKNVSFVDETGNISWDYLNSGEYVDLKSFRNDFFDDNAFLEKIKDSLNSLGEFSDITNLMMDDRALTLQNSSFCFKNKLKFFPICFTISSLIRFYHVYILDIDIDFNRNGLSSYGWKKNHGVVSMNVGDEKIKEFVFNVCETIENDLGLMKFPNNLIQTVVPDISHGNLRFGEITLFNAFFLDDFYALP